MTESSGTGNAGNLLLVAALAACLAASTLAALSFGSISDSFLLAGAVGCSGAAFLAASAAGRWQMKGVACRAAVLLGTVGAAALGGVLTSGSVGLDSMWFSLLIAAGWLIGWRSGRDLIEAGSTKDSVVGFAARRRMIRRFLVAGGLLLVLLAATRDLTHRPQEALLSFVVFLLLVLAVMARGRYAELERRWGREKLSVPAGMGNRWQLLALGFVALLSLAGMLIVASPVPALVRPVGRAAERPVGWLANPVLDLVSLTAAGPEAPLKCPCYGTGHARRGRNLGLSRSHHHGLSTDPRAYSAWIVILLVLGLVAQAVVRSRRTNIPFTVALLAPFRWLWQHLHRSVAPHVWALGDRLPEPVAATLFRIGRPSRLGPRERVIWYYLNTARRAERVGLAREPSDTPAEYEELLGPFLAEARPDLSTLTATLIEARYTDHPLDQETVQRARASANRVKDSLRQLAAREASGPSRS